jgi:hypothetical protein
MRLFKRHGDEETRETPCPKCGVSIPLSARECTGGGWDPRETYVPPETTPIRSLPGTANDR